MDIDQLGDKANQHFSNIKAKIRQAMHPKQTANSIFDINLHDLKDKGINAIILDLDDTLLAKTSTDITPKLYAFIENLKSLQFRVVISSNNRFPSRVQFVANTLELPHIALAFKPLPAPFEKALTLLKSTKEETAIIGDQLFTDILGGNLFGIHTIMVKPLTPETNTLRQFMRSMEKFFLELK